jgi:molecular chaperone Hsp33
MVGEDQVPGYPGPSGLIVERTDTLRRFVFEGYPFRGQLVHVDTAWQAMMEHHHYPAGVRDSLGEAVAATVLLASTLKFEGQLSLQLRGSGPMHLMLVECSDRLALRGVARFRDPPDSHDLRVLSGDGTLTVTLTSKQLAKPYQGIVPLAGERMSDCLGHYFESSEQLPTRVWLSADGTRISGLLLQRLPEKSAPGSIPPLGGAAPSADEVADAWRRVQMMADTVTDRELLQLKDTDLLHRLFSEDNLRVFEPAPVYFRCSCSRERVVTMLKSLGQQEVASIVEEQGAVEVRCEFCNRAYDFDAVDAAGLFADALTPSGPH